jgi:hypothetical protein
MSLVTVSAAVSDFVASAWLVALTCTVAGEGRSAGAVYTPPVVVVPTVALPPAISSTLQLTVVSAVFVTVAVNMAVFPSSMGPLGPVTVTTMAEGGGGGGGTELEPPAPQPTAHAPAARRATTRLLVVLNFLPSNCGRGRIPSAKQAKGQRTMRGREPRSAQQVFGATFVIDCKFACYGVST